MDNFFNIKSYGAKGDGITKDTKSIGKAIDACSRAGGGTVYFPPGVYHSGTICLKDNITIYLEAGATLFSSIDKEDFIFTEAPLYDVFIRAYNTYYASFHKADGKYVWGPFEESTLEGIKVFSKYFKEGLIDKDYFTIKGKEFNDKFFAGKTGIFIEGCSADNLNGRKSNFSASNPTIDPNEAIAICAVKGPNGKYNGTEMMNYWSTTIFNPNIDDEKLDRILTLYDYIATPEGQKLINLGIEGKDYKVEGDKIIITREKDEHGNFQHITKTHPSAGYFYTKVVLPDDWSINDPSIPAITRDQVKTLFKEKQKIENLSRIDYDLTFFSAPNKDKFNIDVADAITEIILSGKDVEDAWNEWKNTVEPKVNAVLEEINGALAN